MSLRIKLAPVEVDAVFLNGAGPELAARRRVLFEAQPGRRREGGEEGGVARLAGEQGIHELEHQAGIARDSGRRGILAGGVRSGRVRRGSGVPVHSPVGNMRWAISWRSVRVSRVALKPSVRSRA